ncbi:response regulator [Dactylosporangium matsuzakiense]|uniref:Response regulator n=1 Tax=Dactylosporangium matsuzakiense TaxID=53360 RepID=A0A9W6KET0_9ACTN|nr:response regulator transcription factor [Dactylosporangium matsuzakiense]UWZ44446.1 response regulator transcription factor [Dactylosporangium matsuzakiense]GLK99388.1 response regulator [Dactylosporangium matsuzakiense]
MIRCVIVDDSERFRASARRLLGAQGIAVVATAADSRQALRAVEEQDPDVVLVDVGLGPESGFELAAKIRDRAVIMVSSLAPDDLAELLAASPAIGYLPKHELSGVAITVLLRTRPPRGR